MIRLIRNSMLCALGCLLWGCADEAPVAPGLPGETLRVEVPIVVEDMEEAGAGGVTRSFSGGFNQVFGAPASTRATAADLAMTAAEKKIHYLYIVQFSGTADNSKMVFKSGEINPPTSTDPARKDTMQVPFDYFGGVDAESRIYVIANSVPGGTVNNTTLAQFRQIMAPYTPQMDDQILSTGLPMCGYADFNPKRAVTTPLVKLTTMVAKLVVEYEVGASAKALFSAKNPTVAVSLVNIASGTSYGTVDSYTDPYRPQGDPLVVNGGVKFTAQDSIFNAGSGQHTFYIAENISGLSGTMTPTDWKTRSMKKAPDNATYFELTGRTANDSATVMVSSFMGDPTKINQFNVVRNHCYRIKGTIINLDDAVDERIRVSPDGFNLNLGGESANCYIVTGKESGSYIKDYNFSAQLVRGNDNEDTSDSNLAGINYDKLPDLSTATSARVIWQTGTGGKGNVIDKIELFRRKGIRFSLGTATQGNAVIGVFASTAPDAPCLWSWHIWRLTEVPGDITCQKADAAKGGATVTFKMMDRNLGAYNNTTGSPDAIGLYYQWGRKDPFPGPQSFTTSEPGNIYGNYTDGAGNSGTWSGNYSIKTVRSSSVYGTEAWAVQHPAIFIVNPSPPYDWMAVKNDCLWGTPWVSKGWGDYNTNNGTKSIYDPCPVGYRVPPQDTWDKAVKGQWNNGQLLTGVVPSGSFWFPAAGNRDFGSGVWGYVSMTGYYWSSSPHAGSSVFAGYLLFNSGAVTLELTGLRAVGLTVRCVSGQ